MPATTGRDSNRIVRVPLLSDTPMSLPPLIASPSPATIDALQTEGRAFGQDWRGRARTKFEEALVKRLGSLAEDIAARALDTDEAVAAFDVAAWDAWEAPVSSAPGARVPSADPSPKARRSAADR